MTVITVLTPTKKTPFQHPHSPSMFFCTLCQMYTDQFTASAIRTKHKRCTKCQKIQHDKRKTQMTPIDLLKKKLYSNFLYQKHPELAQALTVEHVQDILRYHDVSEGDIPLVKGICPNFNVLTNEWNYDIKFKRINLI